jgi:F-type H+-transporting ATPase subunit delta
MISTISARRYAQAIFEIAKAKNNLDEWGKDLKKLTAIVKDQQVIDMMDDPKFPFTKKAELIKQKMGKTDELVMNLCYLLISKGKLKNAGQISDEFESLQDEHKGIKHALVTTAVPVDEAEKQKIANQLEKITGKKVSVKLQVNPAILGGIIARIEDTQIDGSVRNKLELLRRDLVQASK